MKSESNLKPVFDKMLKKMRDSDGKTIGDDGEIIKTKLAPDDRGAWVNMLVEKYLKKEDIPEIPDELKIKHEDIVKEIARREIEKILGK